MSIERLEGRQLLAAADLTGWIGVGNTSSPNNYAVTSAASAGGTLDSRRTGAGEGAAYLGDTSLAVSGGVLSAATAGGFSASGTFSFDASADGALVDPVADFGFFDKDNLDRGAFGFSIADSTTTAFRLRAAAGTTQTSGNGIVVSEGSYTFHLDVNNAASGSGKVRFRLINGSSSVVCDVNVTIPAGLSLQADAFGILQPVAGSPSDNTYTVAFSNINYTGETQLSSGTTPPAAPSNLTATADEGRVLLHWQDNATNESSFVVERRIGAGGSWAPLSTLSADAVAYTDANVVGLTTYYYRVLAQNSSGSAVSNEASATTPELVNIAATSYSRTQIYSGAQATNYQPGDPSWDSWVGTWIMPNGDLMLGVTQASGREQSFHNNPAPFNYSGLDIDVVYLRGVRALDGSGNITWTKVVESDVSFTTAEASGLGTHANNSPTTIALRDGSLIRRVYGWDYGQFPAMPGSAFMQRSTDGGVTWSAMPTTNDGGQTWTDPSPIQEFPMDPRFYTFQPTRVRRLSDDRLVMIGAVWNQPHAQSGASEPVLLVSSDEARTWQRIPFSGPAYSPAINNRFNEWDIAELNSGDLLIMSRPSDNSQRYQGILSKAGDAWSLTSFGPAGLPHSGHPELLKTLEGPVLHIATTGATWTNNAGTTWNSLDVDSLPNLASGDYKSMYYPHSIQTDDGWIYVFSHRPSPGGDDNYGGANQAVFMDKFRLVVSGGPLRGDFNGDLQVSGTDLSTWNAAFGQSQPSSLAGDADNDGDADGADFLWWQRNLGKTSAAEGAFVSSAPSLASAAFIASESLDTTDAAFTALASEGAPSTKTSLSTAPGRHRDDFDISSVGRAPPDSHPMTVESPDSRRRVPSPMTRFKGSEAACKESEEPLISQALAASLGLFLNGGSASADGTMGVSGIGP